MFKRILIANRGEIACRIIKTARKQGIETYAIYSDIDRHSSHAKMADRAICVGPAALSESYLNIEKIITVAQKAGVEAIHPGYGFLSESAEFAKACDSAGLIFIGPSPETLVDMGSKQTAKAIAEKAGVRVIPGYTGDAQDLKTLKKHAQTIGYPLMIKAIMGGGGKGMRLVEQEADFEHALKSCQREAQSSFGDDRVLLEKYLQKPRHIEIQVFGDTHGNQVHMFERDCSPQRRHQKIIEEAPAQRIPTEIKERMYEDGLKIAQAVKYVGAGTVEFLLDPSGDFYFMEMNTRLQVEHSVTESITGLDLVEWQLRVAAGEELPLKQNEIQCSGHALEARIYAEDPRENFLPSSGQVGVFHPPEGDYRLDAGIEESGEVLPNYDPLIAKLIVSGPHRQSCIQKARQVLTSWPILGIKTNIEFLIALLEDIEFCKAPVDVGFVDRHLNCWTEDKDISLAAFRCAAVGLMTQPQGDDPWGQADGWRVGDNIPQTFTLESEGQTYTVKLVNDGQRWVIDDVDWIEVEREGASLNIQCSKGTMDAYFYNRGDGWCDAWFRGRTYTFKFHDPLVEAGKDQTPEHHLSAPMTSKVVVIYVKSGDRVTQGQPLMVLEAMKMEHAIRAPEDGHVGEIFYKLGDVVEEGRDLLEFQGGGDDSPLAQAS